MIKKFNPFFILFKMTRLLLRFYSLNFQINFVNPPYFSPYFTTTFTLTISVQFYQNIYLKLNFCLNRTWTNLWCMYFLNLHSSFDQFIKIIFFFLRRNFFNANFKFILLKSWYFSKIQNCSHSILQIYFLVINSSSIFTKYLEYKGFFSVTV